MNSNVNPGQLKVDLALRGVQLDAAVRGRAELRGEAAAGEANRTVELLLPEDVVVDAAVANGERAPGLPPYRLEWEAEHFFLQRQSERIEVRVVPPPQFYGKRTRAGTPMWQVGSVFGGFIALSPFNGCGFSLRQGPCRLCAGVAPVPCDQEGRRVPEVSEVVETVRAAFAEGAVEFVLFNGGGGDGDPEDGGLAALEPYIRAVKRHFDTLVAVQVHPPATNRWIDRTYATGVDAVCYNVEIHDPELLKRYCPGRVARIGRDRYYDALAYAATIFPSGTVWSDLIVGLEPAESTMQGIDALSRAGVLPVLSFARRLDGSSVPPLVAEEIEPMLAHLFHAVRRAKINMGWVRDLSYAVTPLEARFFAGDAARLSVTQQFYRSRLGGMTARNLARLRRRLRVRTVSDSFDSSHL